MDGRRPCREPIDLGRSEDSQVVHPVVLGQRRAPPASPLLDSRSTTARQESCMRPVLRARRRGTTKEGHERRSLATGHASSRMSRPPPGATLIVRSCRPLWGSHQRALAGCRRRGRPAPGNARSCAWDEASSRGPSPHPGVSRPGTHHSAACRPETRHNAATAELLGAILRHVRHTARTTASRHPAPHSRRARR